MRIFSRTHTYAVQNDAVLNDKALHKTIKKSGNTSSSISIKAISTRLRNFFNSNQPSTPKKNLRELVLASKVVADSSEMAKINFVNTARFNGIKKDISSAQRIQQGKERSQVMEGNLRSLIGKGIMAGKQFETHMPFRYDYVCSDKHTQSLVRDTRTPVEGVTAYCGDNVIASELIPGTPIGNYYNQQSYDPRLKVLQLENGNCGTKGFKINLSRLSRDQPLLVHAGELSGCTVVYAQKGTDFFAFHTGQPGNDSSQWETGSDGVESIIKSYIELSGASRPKEVAEPTNQTLADFLSANFDFASMTYCGHDEVVSSKSNVLAFDYNKESILVGDNKVRVGNAMAMLSYNEDVCRLETISDDMSVDKSTLATESLRNIVSDRKK